MICYSEEIPEALQYMSEGSGHLGLRHGQNEVHGGHEREREIPRRERSGMGREQIRESG
jgi:hypothetical protein